MNVTDQIAELQKFVNSNLPELASDLLYLYDNAQRRETGALETALTMIPDITGSNRMTVVESMIERAALTLVAEK